MTAGYWVNAPPYSSFRRKPRQPRRTHQFRKRSDTRGPMSNPPVNISRNLAAQTIQRKFRQKRYVPKKPISHGTECYQLRLAKQSLTLTANTGSTLNGPKNSVILPCSAFSQHTTCVDSNGTAYTVLGNYIKFVYDWSTKIRCSFQNITNHADNKMGLLLRCHHGVVKIPVSKRVAGTGFASQLKFEEEVLKILKEQLFESNVTSDFLEYTVKNRNIIVNSSFDVRPYRNNMIRVDSLVHTNTVPSTTDTISSATFPPPRCYKVKHPTPKQKTRLGFSSDHSFPLPENLWIPWVMFTSDQLTSNSGYFDIDYSSRAYFTDN